MYNSIISHKTVIFITTPKRTPIPTLGLLLLIFQIQENMVPDKKYEDSYLHSYHHKNPKTIFKSTAMSLPNYKEYDANTMYSWTLPDKKYSDNDKEENFSLST